MGAPKAKRSTNNKRMPLDEQILSRLAHCTSLPSPPGVAMRIIELGNDPAASLGDVADAVSVDQALSTKLLRLANSPLYARQRRIENLRQAITMFGLNGTVTLALSFSLITHLRGERGAGLDYPLFWRRALAAAFSARALGARARIRAREDLFLAGLVQDIGMLALDKAIPDLYRGIGPRQSDHTHVCAMEREAIGADHAGIGAWLLGRWRLAEWLQHAVATSHAPMVEDTDSELTPLSRCVALSGIVADIWWGENFKAPTHRAYELAHRWFEMDEETFGEILNEVAVEVRDNAAAFEIELGDPGLMEALLEQAKETLALRNLQQMHEVCEWRSATRSLEQRTHELEEEARRDALTGLYNRAYLDRAVEDEFHSAASHGWPLAVVFIDLDHFKHINDTHGHPAGDQVLRRSAELLIASTRDSDIVARYGGEEFVIVLPGNGQEGARTVCERILAAFRGFVHELPDGARIRVTASAGVTVHGEHRDYRDAHEQICAADQALYEAKAQGRDRCVLAATGS